MGLALETHLRHYRFTDVLHYGLCARIVNEYHQRHDR
jgi:hypothetical protein